MSRPHRAADPMPGAPPRSQVYFAEHALLPDGHARNVRLTVADGRFTEVRPGADRFESGGHELPGVVVPGLANCHSHAFHRALRGRTHLGGGTFWTWRAQMYALAGRLDPALYLQLARATYAEMALAGITAVGEFHYLHHGAGGRPYPDPNAMGEALRRAAAEAGIRLTLLDACYLAGGLGADGHRALDEVQRRFSDGDEQAWGRRVAALPEDANTRVGGAIHSVRAVPRPSLGALGTALAGRPLHVHLSEQPAENEACRAYYGMTPTRLLDEAGVLGPDTTAVHATHLTEDDIGRLGSTRTTVCFCATTERDLADGIGPARALADAGAPLSVGTDQHASIDVLEEARAMELDERLRSGRRGVFTPGALLAAATAHASIGWPDAGQLRVGARADLVALRLDTPRTAGCDPAQAIYAVGAGDVDTVLVDGRTIVQGGRHRLGDVGALLGDAIEASWRS